MIGRQFCIALLSSIGLSWLVVATLCPACTLVDLGVGWALVAVNGAVAFAVNGRAMVVDQKRFLLWAVGFNGLRAGALLVAIAIVALGGAVNIRAFVIVVLTGHALFMVAEVAYFHRWMQGGFVNR